jgi:hypothetical protein
MPRSFQSAAALLWRAVITPKGLSAVVMALPVLFRMDRLIQWLLVDHPELSALVQPWIAPGLGFAAGVQITRAVIDQIKLSHIPEMMSGIDLAKAAAKLGWDFQSENSLDLLDLGNAVQQSGLEGTLQVWGRRGNRDIEEIWGPLERIPVGHWQVHEPWPLAFLSDNNADLTTNKISLDDGGYFDLHFDREPALWWLRHVARRERGKRKQVDDRRTAKIAESRKLKEQERAEHARKVRPTFGHWQG